MWVRRGTIRNILEKEEKKKCVKWKTKTKLKSKVEQNEGKKLTLESMQ